MNNMIKYSNKFLYASPSRPHETTDIVTECWFSYCSIPYEDINITESPIPIQLNVDFPILAQHTMTQKCRISHDSYLNRDIHDQLSTKGILQLRYLISSSIVNNYSWETVGAKRYPKTVCEQYVWGIRSLWIKHNSKFEFSSSNTATWCSDNKHHSPEVRSVVRMNAYMTIEKCWIRVYIVKLLKHYCWKQIVYKLLC